MASIRFLHGAATHYPEGDTLKKFVFGAIAAMLLVAPVADAKTSRATVVKRNAAAKTVVVANKAGTLRILHNRRDRVGTVLRINGSRIKAVGHARRVHIKGVVTRRSTKAFNLSASGAIVSVRSRGASRTARRGGHSLGQGLNVTATISSNGALPYILLLFFHPLSVSNHVHLSNHPFLFHLVAVLIHLSVPICQPYSTPLHHLQAYVTAL